MTLSERPRSKRRLLFVLGLVLCGCGPLNMKPPVSQLPMRTRPVIGHTPDHAARDTRLSVGSAEVGSVKGTPIYPPGLTAYGRMPDQTLWNYQYNVLDGGSSQRGECVEQVGETKYYGLGETTLDVSCRCFSGDTPTAEMNVQRGEGKATLLPSHRFAVYGTRGSKQGKRSRDILGYRFQSGKSVAAIDVTKHGVAYYAENLTREEQQALTCLYAGLLLHRPQR